jgi:hypothetical protein
MHTNSDRSEKRYHLNSTTKQVVMLRVYFLPFWEAMCEFTLKTTQKSRHATNSNKDTNNRSPDFTNFYHGALQSEPKTFFIQIQENILLPVKRVKLVCGGTYQGIGNPSFEMHSKRSSQPDKNSEN